MQLRRKSPVREIAARWMSYRSVSSKSIRSVETDYNGYALTGIAPRKLRADPWTKAEQIRCSTWRHTRHNKRQRRCLSSGHHVKMPPEQRCRLSARWAQTTIGRGLHSSGARHVGGISSRKTRAYGQSAQRATAAESEHRDAGCMGKSRTKYAIDLAAGNSNVVSSGLSVITNIADNQPVAQYGLTAGRIMFIFPFEGRGRKPSIGRPCPRPRIRAEFYHGKHLIQPRSPAERQADTFVTRVIYRSRIE